MIYNKYYFKQALRQVQNPASRAQGVPTITLNIVPQTIHSLLFLLAITSATEPCSEIP